MAVWDLRPIAAGVAAASLLLAGCTVDASNGSSGGSGTGWGTAGRASGGSSSGASPQPMLVDVDTNRTMSARPGLGVGVFTEYAAGGQWHVWWTCDTNITGFGCSFDVSVSTDGGITNLAGQGLESNDQITQTSPNSIRLLTQTSTGMDGATFETAPGAVITLDAKMNSQDDGALLFFVQNGAVNGNYTGTLTDPLMLEPTTP